MTTAAEPLAPAELLVAPSGARSTRILRTVWKYTRQHPLGAFGVLLVGGFLVIAVIAPAIAPYDARKSVDGPLLAPSSEHWFGTDSLGQDVLSRVLMGSQISLAIGFTVIIINVVLSTLLGLWAGYFAGVVDYVIQRSGEIWPAFPFLIALLLIITLTGTPKTTGSNVVTIAWDLRWLIFAFSLGAVFGGSRIVRGVTIQMKESDFVIAARSLGASDSRIILRHILPNVMPYVIVTATAGLGFIILGEAALSFLGFGVAPGTPSWGQDLSGRNRLFFREAIWVALAPGTAISLTVLGFNLIRRRDARHPRPAPARQPLAGC